MSDVAELPMAAERVTLSREERDALCDTVRRVFADHATEGDVRRVMDSDTGHDAVLWRALADVGVTGLLVDPAHGGSGLGPIELELVMEEAGAVIAPVPLISSAMAAVLLDGAYAERLAAGDLIAAVIFLDDYDWTGRGSARVVDDMASGVARFVPDAVVADVFVLTGSNGVWVVPRDAVTVTPLPTFDRTRRMGDVTLAGAATRIGTGAETQHAFDIGIVALAGEQAGGARRMLNMSTDYARERHQFGRAIGSFQAVKHMAADLLLEAESATSAARDAARQLAEDSVGKGGAGKDAALALAAFACADANLRCAKDGIQMHGGIAFTWDHPAHLYLRRARSGVQLLGDSSHWRERYIQALEAAQREAAV